MATDEKPGRTPLPPGTRRRLQQCFEHGTKMSAAGNFDYATEMYTQCVLGDPANPIYVKSFLANLQKKYGDNKKGGKMAALRTAGAKGGMKKAVLQKDWNSVISSGLEVLKLNPWDTGVLTDMGNACESLEFDESQLEYLRMALDADEQDPEVNRTYGRALERQGMFDEAIVAFQRVAKAKPADEEAVRALADLAVKRTIVKGGYEEAQSSKEVMSQRVHGHDDGDTRLTPEQRLRRAIERDPSKLASYIELSELYLKDDKLKEAEEVLRKGLDASGGGDLNIRDRLEDVQIRRARNQVTIAEEKARSEKTQEALDLYKRMKVELNTKEIEFYSARVERYPTNLGFKFELGVRLQKAQQFTEAIRLFQDCRSDVKRKGQVLQHLADCFYSIKQYKLALKHYEEAIAEISPREEDLLKSTLYKAGRLAEGLKDWDTAERHYTDLAARDFGFKDVSERLDKIGRLRDNGGDPDAV